MKKKITCALLVWMLFYGCRKEQQQPASETTAGTALTLEQVKASYNV